MVSLPINWLTKPLDFKNLKSDAAIHEADLLYSAKLHERARQVVHSYFNKIIRSSAEIFKASISDKVSEYFSTLNGDQFWPKVEEAALASIAQHMVEFNLALDPFKEFSSAEKLDLEFKASGWNAFVEILKYEFNPSTVALRIRKSFETRFRFDSSGRPKLFSDLEEIDASYDTAHSCIKELMDIVAKFSPSESFRKVFPQSSEIVLVRPEKMSEILQKVKMEAESSYMEAKRARTAVQYSIPPWVVLLIIILGWNEFVVIISNPLYLTVSLMLLGIILVVNQLKLAGPLESIVRNFLAAILASLDEKTAQLGSEPESKAADK